MKNIEFFKKENLKDGMMLKIKYSGGNEEWHLKLENKMFTLDGYNSLSDYTDDLKYYDDINKKFNKNFDIIEIGKFKNDQCYAIEDIFDPFNIEIIASRDESKDEMIKNKISELEKQLNELKKELEK